MKLKMYLTAFIAMGMVMGCSEKEIVSDGGDGGSVVNPADGVYISVSVQLPDGGPSMNGGPSVRSNTTEPNEGNSASNSGTEVGKDYENKVSKMLIVLARYSGNGYIVAGTVDTAKDNGSLETVGSTVHATAKISKTALANYYGSDGRLDPSALNEDKVNVFVVCNYTDELINSFKFDENGISGLGKFSEEWIDQICSVTEDNSGNPYDNVSVWKKNNMLMTNASVAPKRLPLNLSEWDDFSSSAKPFNLSGANATSNGEMIQNDGSIRVERSVARFDFKDGSELKGNRYHAVYVKGESESDPTYYVDIVLNRMALVNMSNKFYYFRRVTDAENPSGEPKVGYPELPWLENQNGNYVVDVDYDNKEPGTTHFNFPLFNTNNNKTIDETARGQWYTSKISDVLAYDKESDEYKSYKIWRYVTENTVNSTSRMVNGLSTGIIFKGKMEPTGYLKNPTGEKLNEATKKSLKRLAYVLGFGKGDCSQESLGLSADDIKDIKVAENAQTNSDPILYTRGGMLYLRWPSIREAAIADAQVEGTETYDYSREFYRAVFGNGKHTDSEEQGSSDETSPDNLWYKWQKSNLDTDLLAFKKAATKNGITLYQSSNDDESGPGYYCYYYYWNQHNNDNSGVMGEMEFAVVRNNVYKLAVTKIDRLGHPRLTENDPDPVDPDDPDEKGDVYITVSVEVLPWVVRVNNIEF